MSNRLNENLLSNLVQEEMKRDIMCQIYRTEMYIGVTVTILFSFQL